MVALAWKNWPRHSYNQVPKKIWSYWENPAKVPYAIRLCWESWRKHQPDYEIVILTKDTYKGYVTLPEHILAHPIFNPHSSCFTDALQVQTLAEHGGVWLDSSVLLQQPLDRWMFPKYAEFRGFYRGANPQAIQTWFLACNRGSPFLKAWYKELLTAADYVTAESYVEDRKKAGIQLDHLRDPIGSLLEVALQTVLQYNKHPMESLILTPAEEGPLQYLAASKGDTAAGIQQLCNNPKRRTPLVKIENPGDPVWESEWTTEQCGWVD